MNESKSPLLNAFIKEFGEDLVFNKTCNLDLTQPIALSIFQILDKSFFNNKLSKINNLKLFVGSPTELNPIIQIDYVHSPDFDISDYFALFQPDLNFKVSNTQLKIQARKYGIFINVDQNINLQYAIVTICHEMIHCLDFEAGQLKNQTELMLNKKFDMRTIDYASHFTQLFKQKRLQMKTQNNLTIPIIGDNKTINQLCKELADEAAMMKESDDDLSNLPAYIADKEFQDTYKDCMTFDNDGHILGMTLFKCRK